MILPVADIVEPPRIIAPAPRQVSFGRIVARVPFGTRKLILLVDGKAVHERVVGKRRVMFRYTLPRRDSVLRLVAIDGRGARTRSRPVGPVLGLTPRAAPRASGSRELASLERALREHASGFRGTSAFYVRDLVTGAGASFNATAPFPAGSTLKVALALEVLRSSAGPPAPGSQLAGLLTSTIVDSSNLDANRLAIAIAGSTSVASARVNTLMVQIGLTDSDLFGGYLVEDDELAARNLGLARGLPDPPPYVPPEIRLETIVRPEFGRGKQTTAADLATLFSAIHLAAGGRGPLITKLRGDVTPAEARYLLFLLAHTGERGAKLAARVPGATVAHKGGWISTARHDAGIVYWKGGAFVAAVMTFDADGVDKASDDLAAQAARTSLVMFRRG